MKVKLKYFILIIIGLFGLTISSCDKTNETKYELNPEPIDIGEREMHSPSVRSGVAFLTIEAQRGFNTSNELIIKYGHDKSYLSMVNDCWGEEIIEYEKKQELELSLYREIYDGNENSTPELIYNTTFTLEYFTCADFIYGNEENKFIDEIDTSMLFRDYDNYGTIKYFYIVKPVDGSYFKFTRNIPKGVYDDCPEGYCDDGLRLADFGEKTTIIYSHTEYIYYAIRNDTFTLLDLDDVYYKKVWENIDRY